MIQIVVQEQDAGKKLHRYVRQRLPGVPLSGIYKILRTGRVKVNGKRAKSEYVLCAGDSIHLYMADEDFAQASKPAKKFGGVSRDVDILHEDADLLVVNKPSGLLVHGTADEQKDTLVNRVLAFLYDRDGQADTVFTPAPVNRLDRNTSGIVLFGKTNAATASLAADIANHRVCKWYLAVVRGICPESGEIDASLQRDRSNNRTRAVARDAGNAQPSLTRFVRKAVAADTSVAKVELVSGRTHQIRAHFERIGHPLWGDVKYGGRTRPSNDAEQHQWLHAGWLELADGRRFHAPLPRKFEDVLRQIGYTDGQIRDLDQF